MIASSHYGIIVDHYGMIVDHYGSFPHSVRLAPVRRSSSAAHLICFLLGNPLVRGALGP